MIAAWSVSLLAVGYVGLLFAIACFGEKHAARWRGRRWEPAIYALSLAVWCSSWALYGSIGHAALSGFGFALTYVGPALMLVLGLPVLQKIARTAKAHNITSIADFIGARYGKSHALAALVTVLALVGLIPYLALQLQAVAVTFDTLVSGARGTQPLWRDTALYVALGMALFAILFGLRRVHSNERHDGLVAAIAFESIVKLAAIVGLGLFITFVLFSSPVELMNRVSAVPRIATHLTSAEWHPHWISIALVAALAFVCLPRQFHVAIIENGGPRNLRVAAWIFPMLLVAMAVFIPVIAAAGLLTFPRGTMPELFPLLLPLQAARPEVAVLVFIGGLSAATGTIIVEVVALSTMICNELVVPLLLRRAALRRNAGADMSRTLLRSRWLAAFVVLLAAYGFHRATEHTYSLASIGLISLVAVAQFAPALFIGLYWRRAHRYGAIAGVLGGALVWGYSMVLPSLPGSPHPWRTGVMIADPLTTTVVLSLAVNVSLLWVVSLLARRNERDRQQAEIFVNGLATADQTLIAGIARATSFPALKHLAERLVGEERVGHAFSGPAERYNDRDLAAHTERLLSGAIGAASAHIMVASALRRVRHPTRTSHDILAEASEAILHNHDLLRATLENVTQGIGMFDAQSKLAAWNQRFLDMLDVQDAHAQIGIPLALVLENMPALSPVAQTVEHRMPDGRVLALQTNPIQSGGFVLVCTDVTSQIETLEALLRSERQVREANEYLEQRVNERTRELTLANEQLADATRRAEAANVSKTRFFAAASHDLLQPLHVARILTGALSERNRGGKPNALLDQLDHALGAVDGLLQALLDISKLDTGAVRPQIEPVDLHNTLVNVGASLQPIATQRGLELRVRPSRAVVLTDPILLRRILLNFLSNALRYTRKGTVLIGCRRRGDRMHIEVWDTGVGIPDHELHSIFDEFRRGSAHDAETPPGLGLGLAIVDRIARMLEHPVAVQSWPECGSVFSVSVPLSLERPAPQLLRLDDRPRASLSNKLVLCVDNDPGVLIAMRTLLQGWSCEVLTACDVATAYACIERRGVRPDVVLMDYHLDGDQTGLAALESLRACTGAPLPAILITANYTDTVRKAADAMSCPVLNKPVRPGALRALLAQILSRRSEPPRTAFAG